jgi:transposase
MVKTDNSYQEILKLVHKLQEEILELRKENAILKARIHELEHPKNSNNSSIPPSKDENRPKKNQSLREKSGRKSGGQKGHKGYTLEMTTDPDEIINHFPAICKGCGKDLSVFESKFAEKRQVIELPQIRPICTEHQVHSKLCSCGHLNKSVFPVNIKAPIQYGNNVENLVAYLNIGQYLPYKRISSMLGNLFNLPLSQGSIKNMITRFADKLLPTYENIRKEIESAAIVGSDETGAKLNGDKWWFWTWQNEKATYITASDNRAYSTIEDNFNKGFKNATLVSDRYGAHLKTKANAHQICISHLCRDADYLIELTKSLAIKRLKLLLNDALLLKKQLLPEQYHQPNLVRSFIRKETFKLINADHQNEHKKVKAFFKQLAKSRNHLYEFLYNEHVPPDNNGSERAIRNVKVKQKVSTMFKTKQGINNYAIIRSVFDTCIKREIDIFNAPKLSVSYTT